MAEIGSGLSSLLARYGTDKAKSAAGIENDTTVEKASIGDQDVFMTLYIEQLKNQDPTAPQDTNDMVAQMSQFNQVEQLGAISAQLGGLAASITSSQALNATTLVGKSVFVSQKTAELTEDGGNIDIRVKIPDDAVSTTLTVSNDKGLIIKEYELLNNEFEWDGLDKDGNPLPPGTYQFSASSQTVEGEVVELSTLLPSKIQGVTINGAQGTEINVAGHGKLKMTSELEIVG